MRRRKAERRTRRRYQVAAGLAERRDAGLRPRPMAFWSPGFSRIQLAPKSSVRRRVRTHTRARARVRMRTRNVLLVYDTTERLRRLFHPVHTHIHQGRCPPPRSSGLHTIVQLFRVYSNPRDDRSLSIRPFIHPSSFLQTSTPPASVPDSRYNGPAFSPFSGSPWSWP